MNPKVIEDIQKGMTCPYCEKKKVIIDEYRRSKSSKNVLECFCYCSACKDVFVATVNLMFPDKTKTEQL